MFIPFESNNKKKTVLVTGGAGYIGSHCCMALSEAGYYPVTFDNLSTGHRYAVKWGPLVEADLMDKEAINSAIDEYRPIAVIHFAASAIITESIMNPKQYYDNNLIASLNLFEAMLKNDLKTLIFSSSCATYGHVDSNPITEETLQAPISPYGFSKYCVERVLRDYAKAYDLLSISLRYFNAAGADLALQIGENHEKETHLIPSILQVALEQKEFIEICGKDFATKDGTAIRDYIHVKDLANAHLLALNYLLEHKKSLSINLGTGSGFSVLEIVSYIQKVCKKELRVQFVPKRKGDPAILIADYAKAKRVLKWEPKYSDLDTIVQTSWSWHQKLAKSLDDCAEKRVSDERK